MDPAGLVHAPAAAALQRGAAGSSRAVGEIQRVRQTPGRVRELPVTELAAPTPPNPEHRRVCSSFLPQAGKSPGKGFFFPRGRKFLANFWLPSSPGLVERGDAASGSVPKEIFGGVPCVVLGGDTSSGVY